MYKLTLNDEEYMVQDLEIAKMMIEGDFCFEGQDWDDISDFLGLIHFLDENGFDVEFEEL